MPRLVWSYCLVPFLCFVPTSLPAQTPLPDYLPHVDSVSIVNDVDTKPEGTLQAMLPNLGLLLEANDWLVSPMGLAVPERLRLSYYGTIHTPWLAVSDPAIEVSPDVVHVAGKLTPAALGAGQLLGDKKVLLERGRQGRPAEELLRRYGLDGQKRFRFRLDNPWLHVGYLHGWLRWRIRERRVAGGGTLRLWQSLDVLQTSWLWNRRDREWHAYLTSGDLIFDQEMLRWFIHSESHFTPYMRMLFVDVEVDTPYVGVTGELRYSYEPATIQLEVHGGLRWYTPWQFDSFSRFRE